MKKLLLVLLCASTMMSAKVADVSPEDFNKKIKKGVVVVKIYAPWCGACKFLAPVFEAVSNKMSGVTFLQFNSDEDSSITKKYLDPRNSGLPTMVVFVDGEKVATKVGSTDEDTLKKFIENNKSGSSTKKEKTAEPKKKPMKKEVSKKRPAEDVLVAEEDIVIEQPKVKKAKTPKAKKGGYGKAMKKGEVSSECVGGNCDSACSRGECGK